MGFKPILRTVAEEKSLSAFRAIFLDAKQVKNGAPKFLVNLKSAFNEFATLRTFFFQENVDKPAQRLVAASGHGISRGLA